MNWIPSYLQEVMPGLGQGGGIESLLTVVMETGLVRTMLAVGDDFAEKVVKVTKKVLLAAMVCGVRQTQKGPASTM